jgi:hypothetical protein
MYLYVCIVVSFSAVTESGGAESGQSAEYHSVVLKEPREWDVK